MTISHPDPGPAAAVVELPDGSEPDPYPLYARMREAGEVHLVREPTGLLRWTFVGYELGRAALADPRLTKDPRAAWDDLLTAGYVTGDPHTDQYMFHLLNTDPPEHTRLRAMVQRSFSPARMAARRDGIRATAVDLLDGLAGPAGRDEPVDLITDYALPLAVRSIGALLGVPTDDLGEYHEWAAAGLTLPGAEGNGLTRAEAYRLMRRFFADLIARRAAEIERQDDDDASGDVLSSLLLARAAGDPLTEQETAALLIFLLNTGQEPTVSLLANGMLALLRQPGELARLAADPALLPTAVEEFLRYDGSVALSTLRIAREDIAVAGTVVPKGAIVSIVMNSADRDPRRFDHPDTLDLARNPNPHLGFGHGIHRCLGVPLARMMGEIAFGELLGRHPQPELAVAQDELRWRPTRVMRGLTALPVRLGPAAR